MRRIENITRLTLAGLNTWENIDKNAHPTKKAQTIVTTLEVDGGFYLTKEEIQLIKLICKCW